jgi:phosphoribosylglycinamide formyltransferase-1
MRLGVLVSGSGTNLQAILDACETGDLPAEVVCVVSDREDAYALVRAGCAGLPAMFLDRKAYRDEDEFNHAILDVLQGCGVDYVVMAGYMRLLGKEVLDAFPMHVLNIHPTLLPSFPGAHGIRDAFEYGVKVTGVTVHFANEVFDRGPILAQEEVHVDDDDTVETLEAKIHKVEHRLYPAALKAIASGRVRVEGRIVRLEP